MDASWRRRRHRIGNNRRELRFGLRRDADARGWRPPQRVSDERVQLVVAFRCRWWQRSRNRFRRRPSRCCGQASSRPPHRAAGARPGLAQTRRILLNRRVAGQNILRVRIRLVLRPQELRNALFTGVAPTARCRSCARAGTCGRGRFRRRSRPTAFQYLWIVTRETGLGRRRKGRAFSSRRGSLL